MTETNTAARVVFTYHGMPAMRINGINPDVDAPQITMLAAALQQVQAAPATDGFLTRETDLYE